MGKDVQLDELMASYGAVVLAIGAQLENRLHVPGEELATSSKTFTHWMNGANFGPSLSFDKSYGKSSRCALVIGNGNVALDTARSLVGDPQRFSGTNIGTSAMKELCSSTIRDVAIIGRRGPLQASFAAKELREIFNLCRHEKVGLFTNVDIQYENHSPVTRSQSILIDGLTKATFLEDLSHRWPPLERENSNSRSLSFFFNLSPTKFIKNQTDSSLLATEVAKNTVLPDGSIGTHHAENGTPSSISLTTLPSALAVTCLGYGVGPIPGAENFARTKPRGPLVHKKGCVNQDMGLFVAGWTKTGPAGALASTMLDAYETADCIVSNLPRLKETKNTGDCNWLRQVLCERNIPWVSYRDWAGTPEASKI